MVIISTSTAKAPSYKRHLVSYLKTYERMGLQAIPMRADSGPIGGDDTHEFLVLAETGESEVFMTVLLRILRLAIGLSIMTAVKTVLRS